MSALDDTQQALIRLLASGEWTSGTELTAELGISREAISKRVRRLEDLGLVVESQSGRGYRLDQPLELLDANRIATALGQTLDVHVHDSLASTNAWAMQQTSPCVCLAEHQSAGRGRRGRQWVSPFGQNLYLSLRWELPNWPDQLGSLSLVLGVALVETLRQMQIPAQIKWPNDIYLHGRKLGGLLIEQKGEAQGPCVLVIGLGLNVAMRSRPEIDQAWTSLALENLPCPRNELTVALSRCILEELAGMGSANTRHRLQQFKQFDAFAGQQVSIRDGDTITTGQSLGTDETGRLRLQTDHGERLFSVGDVSLRAAP